MGRLCSYPGRVRDTAGEILVVMLELFTTALRLGLTSFGGPTAHIGYFREEYVERRRWLSDEAFADLVALCQFLPGPASSQLGIAIGMLRRGFWGGFASWLGFTLPSALFMAAFSQQLQGRGVSGSGWLHGLLVAAVAVVAHAVTGMARNLIPDRQRAVIAGTTAILVLLLPRTWTQVLAIVASGGVGWWLYRREPSVIAGAAGRTTDPGQHHVPVSRELALVSWIVFALALVILPLVRYLAPVAPGLTVADTFFRAGSLVFGGGHVVLPLLQAEVVGAGWVSDSQFLAGYGMAQAVPGPLFTFAAYLGAAIGGPVMAIIGTAAIFAPSFLLITGTLPYWQQIRRHAGFRAALAGVNAAVVGLLLAALYDPIWVKAITHPVDFSLALAAFGMLVLWRVPAWAVVLFCAAGGSIRGWILA